MKVLYVCTANALRSRTADDFLGPVFPDHEIRSAGTDLKQCLKNDTIGLTEELLEWADIILVMEQEHRKRILYKYKNGSGKVKVLGIPDVYDYGSELLIDKLIWRSEQFIGPASSQAQKDGPV